MTTAGLLSGVLAFGAMIQLMGPVVGAGLALANGLGMAILGRLMMGGSGLGVAPVPGIRDYPPPSGRNTPTAGPADRWRQGGPRAVLRRCRWTTAVMVVLTAAGCLALRPLGRAADLSPLSWPWGPASTPLTAAAVTAAALSYPLMMTAWGRYQLARWWLACRRGTPADLIGVLEDAAERGVVRQVGDIWEFAHPTVRRALAATHAAPLTEVTRPS
jgi:hypothetical protein